ncbi:MAG: site-2 protease family protein [Planctomycetales bacterium]|nr:site-2 protease family protein [Planctomycetales bacterium]
MNDRPPDHRSNRDEDDFGQAIGGGMASVPSTPLDAGSPFAMPHGGGPPQPVRRPPARRLNTRPKLVAFLFVATCLSTTHAGSHLAELDAQMTASEINRAMLWSGLQFTTAVMGILLAHEMGHYLQAIRYGVPATLPFFIPMPISPFGTMGAVILQQAGSANRRALFDIAITGPLAGLVVTIPITLWGLQSVEVIDLPENPAYPILVYGDPPLLRWMMAWVHGPLSENQTVLLNPLVFAGWVGIFITALNLLPIGQLDGGHILYSLIGKSAHVVAIGLLFAAAGYMLYSRDPSFIVLLLLLLLMGPKHPPTADDTMPLGAGRHVLGWLTLAFLSVGLTLNPIDVIEPANNASPPTTTPDGTSPKPPSDSS